MDRRIGAWADSGAMALTGRADRPPLGPPAPLVDRLLQFDAVLRRESGRETPDPLALLGERAALLGLARRGDVSCGGATRLVRSRDGWLAVTMARADDIAAVPAWLELERDPADVWDTIEKVAATRQGAALVERARLLGLPVCELGEHERHRGPAPPAFGDLPVRAHAHGAPPDAAGAPATVVDLSSLWAGPLCGNLLQLAGLQVVKVESKGRPDGARHGPSPFFDLLNGGKQSVVLDLDRNEGIRALQTLVEAADVVIEASRPRALQQLGVDAHACLAAPTGPTVWVSITGYGRDGDTSDRVAFGDDAAAAGGLVVWDGDGPCFCADAIADPVTGIAAAAAALVALHSGRRWMVDVAMAGVAADLAGPTLDAAGATWSPPRARPVITKAAPLGADTRAVLSQRRGAASLP